ncbi:MAG TPA: hypothetical protein VFA07_09530 [Chthonomonadaceae bacterium]|nr:hypothetical protein [Chthonomonadaceae bacterium]
MSLAFIYRRTTPPGAIAPGMRLREALALAILLLIERTPEGPVLRDFTSTEEAVALFLEELKLFEAGPEGRVY